MGSIKALLEYERQIDMLISQAQFKGENPHSANIIGSVRTFTTGDSSLPSDVYELDDRERSYIPGQVIITGSQPSWVGQQPYIGDPLPGQAPWVGDLQPVHPYRVEERFTYRRVRRPDGTEAYERVPYNPSEPVLEPPVVTPGPGAGPKNGELPGQGSVAVEAIQERMRAAEVARLLNELAEREAAAAGAIPAKRRPQPQDERSYDPKRKIEV